MLRNELIRLVARLSRYCPRRKAATPPTWPLQALSTHFMAPPFTTAFVFQRSPELTIPLATIHKSGSKPVGTPADDRIRPQDRVL